MGLGNYIISYHLVPYVPEIKKFHLRVNNDRVFESSDINVIKAYYKDKLSFANKDRSKLLEEGINNAIKASRDNYNLLVEKAIEKMSTANLDNLISKDYISADINLTLNRTKLRSKRYEKAFKNIVKKIFPDKADYIDEKSITTAIQMLQGQLNNIRGDIFESLVTDLLDNVGNEIINLSESTLDNFTKKIQENINKYKDVSVKIENYGNIRMSGDETKSDILITIGDNKIIARGARGKADIIITGLSGDIKSMGLSAKNYNIRRKISIVSGANVPGLITLWPEVDTDTKNLALNSLSGHYFSNSFNIMKNVFLLQGMSGTINEDVLSSFLIVSTPDENHPVRVFSIYEILFNNAADSDSKKFDGEFKYSGMPIEGVPRSEDDFLNFIKTAKLSIQSNMSLNRMIKNYN